MILLHLHSKTVISAAPLAVDPWWRPDPNKEWEYCAHLDGKLSTDGGTLTVSAYCLKTKQEYFSEGFMASKPEKWDLGAAKVARVLTKRNGRIKSC